MTMLQRVKLALRISHNSLDAEIEDNISAAKEELKRAGVDPALVHDAEDALVIRAIKTYVLAAMAQDSKMIEGYEKSLEYQLDCIRKSPKYRRDDQ